MYAFFHTVSNGSLIMMFAPCQDVALAALYVSSKMHDTLKKPREILMVAYAVRFPELAAKSKSVAGEIDMDPAVSYSCFFQFSYDLTMWKTVEHDRQRLLAVERLILETVSFNFTSRLPFPYVIKAGRALRGLFSTIGYVLRLLS